MTMKYLHLPLALSIALSTTNVAFANENKPVAANHSQAQNEVTKPIASDKIKAELDQYFKKKKEIDLDSRQKREALKATLSAEAKKHLDDLKEFKRKSKLGEVAKTK